MKDYLSSPDFWIGGITLGVLFTVLGNYVSRLFERSISRVSTSIQKRNKKAEEAYRTRLLFDAGTYAKAFAVEPSFQMLTTLLNRIDMRRSYFKTFALIYVGLALVVSQFLIETESTSVRSLTLGICIALLVRALANASHAAFTSDVEKTILELMDQAIETMPNATKTTEQAQEHSSDQ